MKDDDFKIINFCYDMDTKLSRPMTCIAQVGFCVCNVSFCEVIFAAVAAVAAAVVVVIYYYIIFMLAIII